MFIRIKNFVFRDYEKNIDKNLIRIMNQSKDDLIKLGFEVSFKPHPASKVKSMDDNITLTDRDLEKLLNDHNYIVSSNSTSAVIEALSCGLKTFLFVDKNNLNLSPLKNTKIEKRLIF